MIVGKPYAQLAQASCTGEQWSDEWRSWRIRKRALITRTRLVGNLSVVPGQQDQCPPRPEQPLGQAGDARENLLDGEGGADLLAQSEECRHTLGLLGGI